MKKVILTAVLLLAASTSMARDRKFSECVSERLQAYNSDIYYNLSKEEIMDLLDTPEDARSSAVVYMAKACLENSKP